jgi:hypothetical protein
VKASISATPARNNAKIFNLGVSSFNVLNHANLTNYIGSIRSPLFGTATTTLAGRQMQFGAHYQFWCESRWNAIESAQRIKANMQCAPAIWSAKGVD